MVSLPSHSAAGAVFQVGATPATFLFHGFSNCFLDVADCNRGIWAQSRFARHGSTREKLRRCGKVKAKNCVMSDVWTCVVVAECMQSLENSGFLLCCKQKYIYKVVFLALHVEEFVIEMPKVLEKPVQHQLLKQKHCSKHTACNLVQHKCFFVCTSQQGLFSWENQHSNPKVILK